MLQPFDVAEATLDAFRRYVRTGFPLRDPVLEADRERLIDEGLLWTEPHVSLARPGNTGPMLAELEGLLLPETIALPWGFDQLYRHQAEAIERLAPAREGGPLPTLVLSGTGSGKTESFLMPIIDACLRNPAPGVKALILYPMNALANDQLKRLRQLLVDSSITFGRYTGDAPERDEGDSRRAGRPADAPPNLLWSRDAMRTAPPNILLTNYAQLEYILLRGRDAELFSYGAPRYLVVDEIHLFTGVLGAEVAALLRRFRQHVGASPAEMVPVGTSATAGSDVELDRLLDFAGRFFGVTFERAAAIAETPDPYREMGMEVPPAPDLTVERLRAAHDVDGVRELARHVLGVELEGDEEGFRLALGEVIDRFRTVGVVERALDRPAPVSAAAAALAQLPERAGVGEEALRLEAQALLLLGAAARQRPVGEDEPEPRLRPRAHQLVRSLGGLSRCLDPDCGRLDRRSTSTCATCGSRAVLLASCRTCGEAYWMSPIDGEGLGALARLTTVEPRREQTRVFLATPDQLPDRVDEDEEGEAIRWEPVLACPSCGAVTGTGLLRHLPGCQRPTSPGVEYLASDDAVHCPRCGDKGRQDRPILLPLRGSAAASVAVLTQMLGDELRAREGEPGGRLLVFADSRQDAAQQAGYADDQGARITTRQLMYRAVGDGAVPLPELTRRVASAVADDDTMLRRWLIGESDQLFAERSAPDYEPPTEDVTGIRLQLEWEVTLELTERARRRFSLEREGLLAVELDKLDEIVARLEAAWPGHPFASSERLGQVIRAVADVMRYTRAVDQQLLQRKPRELTRNHGIRVGDRAVRHTRGYAARKFVSGRDQIDIRAWTNDRYVTRMCDLVGRVLGRGPTKPETTTAVESLVSRLSAIGLLVSRRADARTRSMLDHKRLVVRRREEQTLWRCFRCGLVRSAHLKDLSDRSICVNWRCSGTPEPYEPDPGRDFYRRQYISPPRRLIVREHSGQVGADERIVLEERFNDRQHPTVDALACTPTLEVGVSLDDLNAVLLRNLPPSAASYAQRVGRAGRRSMVALAVGHAGHGPHDSYFFDRPGELIAGQVRAPAISLDNEPLLRRHLNSLILETLRIDLPDRWVPLLEPDESFVGHTVADPDGVILESTLRPFEEALADPEVRQRVLAAVRGAFTSVADPAPPPNIEALCEEQVALFPAKLRDALNRWCWRYKALLEELAGTRRARGVRTEEERRVEERLENELRRMAQPATPEQLPLGFLGTVGFLPRYGFTGDTVLLHPSRSEEPIVQAAQVAVTAFAPGNTVYARGRKLRIRRLDPAPISESEAGAEFRDNVIRPARRCDGCEYVTYDPLVKSCPYCERDLVSQAVLGLTGVRGGGAPISSEDEYRDRTAYDVLHALGEPANPPEVGKAGSLEFRLSRGREITVVNRGLVTDDPEGPTGFTVCTFCGFAEEGGAPPEEDEEPEENRGHSLRCPGRADPRADVILRGVWLAARVKGDVLEVPLPDAAMTEAFAGWRRTFAEAMMLGIRESMLAGRRDLDAFERRTRGVPETLVIFDTMPGGTGYLPKLLAKNGEGLSDAARAALAILEGCDCADSCHRCLRDFWNQRNHALLNRHEVLATLRRLAGGSIVHAEAPEDDRFESFLELEFFIKLKEAGLPEPTLQVERHLQSGRMTVVDAEYRDPDVSIFLDGRAYHSVSQEKIEDDLRKRNDLEAKGVLVLEFTYQDVMERFEEVAAAVVLARESGGARPAAEPAVGPGLELLSSDGGRLIVKVDPETWVRTEDARQASLASANALRLVGWRLERIAE